MSWLSGCKYRAEFDRYATTKSGGQFLLSAGLLADNITELVDIYKAGPDAEYYYYPLMALLAVTLALNFLGIILSLILALQRYPTSNPYIQNTVNPTTEPDSGVTKMQIDSATPAPCPNSMKIMNDVLTVTTALVFILVATKSSIREGRSGLYQRCENCTFTRM